MRELKHKPIFQVEKQGLKQKTQGQTFQEGRKTTPSFPLASVSSSRCKQLTLHSTLSLKKQSQFSGNLGKQQKPALPPSSLIGLLPPS
jgi:hypothetical protein